MFKREGYTEGRSERESFEKGGLEIEWDREVVRERVRKKEG